MKKEIIVDKIRIQILSNDILRIEYNEKNKFLDEDTFFIPNRNNYSFDGNVESYENNEFIVVKFNNLEINIPKNNNGLKDVFVYSLKENRKVYIYKNIKNNGELPLLDKTPYIYSIIDNPRIVCPKEGYSYINKNNKFKIERNVKDIYLLVCENDAKKLRQLFVELTGRNEMVRLSTLGLWSSRYFKYDEVSAKQMIEDYAKYDIPLDNMVLDTDWRKASDRGIGYDIDTNLFPEMKAFFKYAHDRGVEIMFNDHPEPLEGAKNLLDYKEIKYREEKLQGLLEMGLDYWWYDRNWHTKLISPVKEINPETFGLYLFTNITENYYKRLANSNIIYRRQIIMGNINDVLIGDYLGIKDTASHRYSIQWTGDIGCNDENILQEIKTLIQASNNCVGYVNFDCGGHIGNPEKELYLRWIKFGAFTPVIRPHCNNAVKIFREPWNYDEETLNIAREYINMRYRLLPYIYQKAFINYETGEPIFKAMGYTYPNDKKSLKCNTQYMLGDNILISPIYGEPLTIVPNNNFTKPIKTRFYQNRELEGEVIVEKQYSIINQVYDKTSPDPKLEPYDFSAIFESELCFKEDVELYICNDDGTRVYIDDELVIDDWKCHYAYPQYVTRLNKNQKYKFKMDYFQGGDKSVIKLMYKKVMPKCFNYKYGDRKHKFYIPEGKWINVFTGEIYEESKNYTRKFKINQFPIFVREGTLLPLAQEAKNTKEQLWNELTLDIYPSKVVKDDGYIYEDDTETTAYKVGEYRKQNYHLYYDNKLNAIVVKLDSAIGKFKGERYFDNRKIIYRYHLLEGLDNIKKVEFNEKEINYTIKKKKMKNYPFNYNDACPDNNVLIIKQDISNNNENVLIIYLN